MLAEQPVGAAAH